MKKLTTISLFIFGVVVAAILAAGLVFYQNKKDSRALSPQTGNLVPSTTVKSTTIPSTPSKTKSTKIPSSPNKPITIPPANTITLNMVEIAKHNNQNDCWMLISGKVYDITNYFGSHPGGSSTMTPSCGTDATAAYMTKDPYATSSGNRSAHSYRAESQLADYYIGNFNQTIRL